MIKATLQTHQSTKINEKHNERKIPVPHADREYGEKNNWYWAENKTEKEFYNETFEASWKHRNDRQTRKDRKYDCSYFEYLKGKSEQGKKRKQEIITAGESKYNIKKATIGIKPTSHELVVGIGNIKDNPYFGMNGEKQEISKEILQRYILGFNQRNKGNVVMYNAAIHTDEAGICHAHIDFCFVSTNKHGEKEVSQTAALKELGFISDEKKQGENKRENAITKWRNNERKVLKKICKEYDIEIISGEKGKKHLEKEEYQLEQDKKKLKKQKDNLSQQETEINKTAKKLEKKSQALDNFIKDMATGKKFEEHYENEHYKQRDNRLRAEINNLWKEYQQNNERYWPHYRNEKNELFDLLKDTNRDLKNVSYNLNRTLNNITNLNSGLLVLIYRIITAISLFFNKKHLEKEAAELQKRNIEIMRNRKIIVDLQKQVKDALKSEDVEQIKQTMKNWENALNKLNRDLRYELDIEQDITKNENIEASFHDADDVLGL